MDVSHTLWYRNVTWRFRCIESRWGRKYETEVCLEASHVVLQLKHTSLAETVHALTLTTPVDAFVIPMASESWQCISTMPEGHAWIIYSSIKQSSYFPRRLSYSFNCVLNAWNVEWVCVVCYSDAICRTLYDESSRFIGVMGISFTVSYLSEILKSKFSNCSQPNIR